MLSPPRANVDKNMKKKTNKIKNRNKEETYKKNAAHANIQIRSGVALNDGHLNCLGKGFFTS